MFCRESVLLLAQAAAKPTGAGAFCFSRERRNAVGGCGEGGTGADAGIGRAAAHRHGGGCHDPAGSAGSPARMIHLPASVRVYVCLTACDMRKSFDGLHALGREHLGLGAFAGHLFVFASRRKDRVKILYWDRDGFAMWSKRHAASVMGGPFNKTELCHFVLGRK